MEPIPSHQKFHDHFSGHSADYARFRPTYPPEMFSVLAGLCERRQTAWDVGTGSGQAALLLAEHFDRVLATDPSAEQIRQAGYHPRINYTVASAETSNLPDHSVDLICVAQALHWFDFAGFFSECDRVAKPGCVLAAWCYELLTITPEIDGIITRYYRDIVGDFWPAQRSHIEARYTSIPFPYPSISTPEFSMRCDWTLGNLLGYLNTWSATRRYEAARSFNPLTLIHEELASCWSEPDLKRVVIFPLTLLVFRVKPVDHPAS